MPLILTHFQSIQLLLVKTNVFGGWGGLCSLKDKRIAVIKETKCPDFVSYSKDVPDQ